MYNDAFQDKNRVQVSVVQIILICCIVLVAFIIPASIINNFRQDASSWYIAYTPASVASREQQFNQGKVAGASTTSDSVITIPLINYSINLNSETGTLMMGGCLLLGIALIILIYLLTSPKKKKQMTT